MKKSLLIFLAMLLAAGTVSCGSKPAEETTAETAAETVPETAAETELTFEAEDFGGIDFTFFGFEPHSKDWVANTYSEAFAEGENGEVINDAIFRRNMKVEELYNIRIHALGTDRSQIGPEALQMILAGDDVYQVVNVSGSTASTLLNQPDALYDLLDIATLDLTNPWWDSNSADSFTINGRLYNVVGDMNIRSFFSSVVLLLNRQMITEYGLEDPFTLVREDRWTIDKLTEYASAVTLDLDGDGTVGIEDSAGFFGEDVSLLWGLNSMNIQTISNVDGTPVITLNTEQTVTGIEKYVHLIRSSETGIYASTVSAKYTGENIWRTRMLPMLMNDQLLFYNSTIGTSLDLRVMDSDFGIIPMPKYDEKQEQYYASTHPAYLSFVTIPTSNPEPERTGTILEAVNAYSMEYVVPAVYQTTLVGKVIRDVESEEMLDIIFANRVYDIGYLFNWGDMSIFVSNFSQQNNTNFASGFAKSESKFQADIDKYLAAHPKE